VLVKIRRGEAAPCPTSRRARMPARFDAIGRAGVRRVRSRSMSSAALLARLANHPAVEYVEPNYILHATADPNDPSFPQLWGLKNVGQSINSGPGESRRRHSRDAGVELHDRLAGPRRRRRGHRIDYTHPDLADNMWSAPSSFTVTIAGQQITCPAGSHGFNAITMSCNRWTTTTTAPTSRDDRRLRR
jgi:hypothetical protein